MAGLTLWILTFAANVALCLMALMNRRIRLYPLMAFAAFSSAGNIVGFALRNQPERYTRANDMLYFYEAMLLLWLSAELLWRFIPKLKSLILIALLVSLVLLVTLQEPAYIVAGCLIAIAAALWITPADRPVGDEYTFLLWSLLILAGGQRLCALLIYHYGNSYTLSRLTQCFWLLGILLLTVALCRFDDGCLSTAHPKFRPYQKSHAAGA